MQSTEPSCVVCVGLNANGSPVHHTCLEGVGARCRPPCSQERARSLAGPPGQLPSRGILINAGGSRLTTNLVVTLHTLRRHLNCTLPVEVAWQVGWCPIGHLQTAS